MFLCWCSTYLNFRPLPPPAEDWWLVECLRGPERETIRMRSGEPSLRKLSLATREGALGYWTPQLLPLPNVLWRLPRVRGQNTPPPPLWGRLGGACAPAPRWGRVPLVAYCDPRLPLQVGGGTRWAPPGVWQVGGTGAWVRCVCTRSAPHGVVSLGAEGGRCWGCNVQLALASPTLQPWCGRAYRACPFPTSHSWWRRVVTVRAASLECDPQDVEPQGGSLG